jgi:GT2 family glycosyltransferase
MRSAVITTVHDRAQHLHRQLDGINSGARLPDIHVIVAMDDPAVTDVVAANGSAAHVVHCENGQRPLPVASARNIGALAAVNEGADLLVFLDVDCIPGRNMLSRYCETAVAPEHRAALLCGPVTYLPPPLDADVGYPRILEPLTNPHPARPVPRDDDVLVSTDYELFWSLSFALTSSTWRTVGGFCEHYRGYGAEDTDFAQMARAAGVPMRWVGGAHAYHQFHPVSDPPVEHVDDIVRNAAVFHRRWGWWPMSNWLIAFEQRGLIQRDGECRLKVLRSASEELKPADSDKHNRGGRTDRPHQHCRTDMNDAAVAVWTQDEVEHRRRVPPEPPLR